MRLKYKTLMAGFYLFLCFTLSSFQTHAHHSLVGEFDTSVNFELRGVVTRIEWYNPHIWIALDVTNEDGSIDKWDCEMGSPNRLIRAGWKKEDLPLGTIIKVQVVRARDGSKTCSTRKLTLDDDTPVFTQFGRR